MANSRVNYMSAANAYATNSAPSLLGKADDFFQNKKVRPIVPTIKPAVDLTPEVSRPVEIEKIKLPTAADYTDPNAMAKNSEFVTGATSSILTGGAQIAKAAKVASDAKIAANALSATTAATNAATTGAAVGTTAASGTTAATAGTTAATGLGTVAGAATSLGLSLAGTGIGFAGDKMQQKALKRDNLKGYAASQMTEYAGKAMSLGSTIGGFATPVGAAIGGGIGLVAGAIGGGIYGLINKKKILNDRGEQRAEVNKFNDEATQYNTKMGIQYSDRLRQRNLNNMNVRQFKKGGLLRNYIPLTTNNKQITPETTIELPKKLQTVSLFKTEFFRQGGQMKQPKQLDLSKLTEEQLQQLQAAILEMHSKGAKPEDIAAQFGMDPKIVVGAINSYMESQNANAPAFKKGGKMKSAVKCKKGCAPMFRRGGTLDLEKENVILDGPSHDDKNKTGIAGDKGLPIVKNGKKMAEIESKELVINAKSSDRMQELRKKAKAGNEEAIKELGNFVHEELAKNTYDYSNVMK